jgi:hypothetical protein
MRIYFTGRPFYIAKEMHTAMLEAGGAASSNASHAMRHPTRCSPGTGGNPSRGNPRSSDGRGVEALPKLPTPG